MIRSEQPKMNTMNTINISVRIPDNQEELSIILEEVRQQLEKKLVLQKFDFAKLKSASHIGIVGPRCSGKTTLIQTILERLIEYEKVYGLYFTPSQFTDENTGKIEGYLEKVLVDHDQLTDSYQSSLLKWLENWQLVLKRNNQPTVVCDDCFLLARDNNAYIKFKETCEAGYVVSSKRFIWSCQSNKFVDCQFLFVSPYCNDVHDYVSNLQLINQMKNEKGFFVVEFNKNNKVEKVSTFVPNN